MNSALRAIVNRFKEPSSWAGFSTFAALVGVTQPVYAAITLAVSGVCAVAAILLPEGTAK